MNVKDQLAQAVAALKPQLEAAPTTLIICGSGLGAVAQAIDTYFSVSYKDIPHCLAAHMPGHAGQLLFGRWGATNVVCMQGRLHTYEEHTPAQTVFPLQLAWALGARRLIATNASGAINTAYRVGDLMLIADHINFTGANPLSLASGDTTLDGLPVHDLDMTYAYTPALRAAAKQAAAASGIKLQEGVYLGLRGPTFETPAEIRAFRAWGADAVGMSTVHEVICARSLGMEVLGLSLISNMAAGIEDAALATSDIVKVSEQGSAQVVALLNELL